MNGLMDHIMDDESNGLADINGGSLPNHHQSIFAQIEQGLLESPSQPAVICMHQPADHLANWIHRKGDLHSSTVASNSPPDCLTLTYNQLHGAALKLAGSLAANGILPGSTCLCVIPNGGEYALILWACAILRLTLASLDPAILDSREGLVDYLQVLQPAVVFAGDLRSSGDIESVLIHMPIASRPHLKILVNNESHTPLHGWENFHRLSETNVSTSDTFNEAAVLKDARNDDPDRIHSILFTSGTSAGRPKGCPLRVGSMTHILESQSWLITPNNCSRVLQQAHNSRAIGPQHTLQTWRAGGAIVMPTGPSFAIEHTLEALQHHGVTFIVVSPAMVHALAHELPRLPVGTGDSVKTIQVGGDAITREVLVKCAKLFPRARVCVNHGMSEGGGFFKWPFFEYPVEDIPYWAELCPVGAVAPGARVRIWQRDGGKVALRGDSGELHVSCDSLIEGYLGGVEASSFFEDSDGNRWMNTGDVAMIIKDGLVYILGRSKDAIMRLGRAIMPAALESCVEKYTGAQACIVAVPNPLLGHEPFAVVENFNGFTQEEITRHVTHMFGEEYRLGGVISLEQIALSKFPVNATHKVMKLDVQKAVLAYISSSKPQLNTQDY
ncbi:acetyl-CoA synthetase-like protein [Hypoxylon sp. FL0890]|nr:acetyl-CoA synthetase-like protein [Hypoxylon sp. FL0890]